MLTAVFLWVILGATNDRAPVGITPLAIGPSFTLIHLIAIPVTHPEVNPAWSLAMAFYNPSALVQVWLFVGAETAGLGYKVLTVATA